MTAWLTKCECSAVKIDGRCPVCEPLRAPRLRRLQVGKRARVANLSEHGRWLNVEEARDGAARAMKRKKASGRW